MREVQVVKFGEYVDQLTVPANMNLVKVKPLRGTSLFIFDSDLVFLIVERFFGGSSGNKTEAAGKSKDFTATELRVVQRVLSSLFTDMKEAWAPVMALDFEHIGSEINPHFANIVAAAESVVVSCFHLELENGEGDLHVTLPYAMIEPIRDRLLAGVQSDRGDRNRRWLLDLKEGIRSACVEITSSLAHTQITLSELLALKPGDVLPVEISEMLVAEVDGVPVFNGRFGTSRGHLALEVAALLTGEPEALTPFQQESNHE